MNKKLGLFCIRHIIKSYMLSQGWGKYTEGYGWSFSVYEWELLEDKIKQEELPSGYYDMCDLIGVSYSMGDDA